VEPLLGEAPRRTRLGHRDRHDRILGAAQELFAHRAYESVSTTEVAEAAGTSRTNVHYYFGTKRNLYLEVITRFARLPLPLSAGRPDASRRDNVDLVFAQWLDLVEANAETFLALIRNQRSLDAEIEAVLEHSLRAWEDRLLRLLNVPTSNARSRAAIRSFQAMVTEACDQWLHSSTLAKDDVRRLLTSTLLAIGDQLSGS
jgi:AcrR family transcriptional regulator